MVLKLVFIRLWRCYAGYEIESFSWAEFFRLIAPIGVTTALDIAFSNLSLKYITVTLYTITKTSTIAFTFIWALGLGVEKFRIKTCLTVVMICIGIVMAVTSPTPVSVIGLCFCLTAAACGGLRWVVTEKLIAANSQCSNPFVCLFHFAPVSALVAVPLCVGIDIVPFMESQLVHQPNLLIEASIFMLVGGLCAFCLILVEVKLVQLTSSLTMGVLGQLKELLQICAAIIVYHDHVSTTNAIGLIIALSCVGVYKWIKRSELKEYLKNEVNLVPKVFVKY
jgi:solute carrier family 35 protein C2